MMPESTSPWPPDPARMTSYRSFFSFFLPIALRTFLSPSWPLP
jgi:hypothetical protein